MRSYRTPRTGACCGLNVVNSTPRAAWGLEAASAGRLVDVAAVLGYHYAKAGEMERAVHHLVVAGTHAAAHFANAEAIASYRNAIEIADLDLTNPIMAKVAVEVRADLAQVFLRSGSHSETREVLQQALRLVEPGKSTPTARLYSMLAFRAGILDHRYEAAAGAFKAADDFLGGYSEDYDGTRLRSSGSSSNWTAGPPFSTGKTSPGAGGRDPRAARPVVQEFPWDLSSQTRFLHEPGATACPSKSLPDR